MNKYTKPILIAELGINWQGDFDTLLSLADSAFENGADLVKLQTRTPRLCVPKKQWYKTRKWFDGTEMSYIEYKEKLELSEEKLDHFDAYIATKYGKNKWFSSVWDKSSVDKLTKYRLPMLKIPSAKITDHELIKHAASKSQNLMISTGMSTERQVKSAIDAANTAVQLIIMACHSAYPTPPEEEDLNKVRMIREILDDVNSYRYNCNDAVGFSSHAITPFIPLYSIFVGAEYIEVHYTLDRSQQGTDHAASLEPAGLKLLSRELDRIPKLFNSGEIFIHDSELPSLKKLRGLS